MATGLQALICPQCAGQVELDNEQEYGFCKYCGTRVQNTNFMKLKGNVSIDYTEQVKRFLANARRAKAKEDWEEVEKYYNLVEQNEPENIEAIFYSAYGKSILSLYDQNIFLREYKFGVLCNSISVLDDNFDPKRIKEEVETIKAIYKDIVALENMNFVYNIHSYGDSGAIRISDKNKTYALFDKVFLSFKETIENILLKMPSNKENYMLIFDVYKILTNLLIREAEKSTSTIKQNELVSIINQYYQIMSQFNPQFNETYKLPKKKLTKEQKLLKGLGIFFLIYIFIGLLVACSS